MIKIEVIQFCSGILTHELTIIPAQDGKATARTPSLRIPSVERFDAGIYECEASNGVGTPAKADLNLQVGDPSRRFSRSWINFKSDL